jgi:hypothetical protein
MIHETAGNNPMPQRFAAAATIYGYEVIATDTGRSVGFEREDRREANGIAQSLNRAAMQSHRALASALRGA